MVQKVKWKKSGEIRKEQYTFLYSGDEKQANNGIGFYVSSKMKNLANASPVSGRVAIFKMRMDIVGMLPQKLQIQKLKMTSTKNTCKNVR